LPDRCSRNMAALTPWKKEMYHACTHCLWLTIWEHRADCAGDWNRHG
jgi:hypothetical protein